MSEEGRSGIEDREDGRLSTIEEQLSALDPEIFEGIPEQKRDRIVRSLAITLRRTHVGPLPDPETLKEYAAMIPEGADRIMKMAEKQLHHRMEMENRVIRGQMLQSNIGQIFAFLIGLAALASATYCIVSGHEWAGSILGIGGMTGLVTAFIKGREHQSEDLGEKHPQRNS